MTYRNYIIEYESLDASGHIIKYGKMRAKNKMSEFEAMAGLDNHLKKTVPGHHKMNVKKIRAEGIFDSIFGPGHMEDFLSKINKNPTG